MPDNQPGDTSVLENLFRHNTWANLKLLDVCARLSDEQLRFNAVGAYGSIMATLAHLVGAEASYVTRATGKLPANTLTWGVWPGFDALKDLVRWAEEELIQMAVAARAADIVRETDPEEQLAFEFPLSSFLVQVINHATEHRAQVSAMITLLGITPPEMDGWMYMEEAGQFRQLPMGAGDGEAG